MKLTEYNKKQTVHLVRSRILNLFFKKNKRSFIDFMEFHLTKLVNCLIELITLVLLFTNFKSLASLKWSLGLALAFLAFKTKDQLLGLLSLPMI